MAESKSPTTSVAAPLPPELEAARELLAHPHGTELAAALREALERAERSRATRLERVHQPWAGDPPPADRSTLSWGNLADLLARGAEQPQLVPFQGALAAALSVEFPSAPERERRAAELATYAATQGLPLVAPLLGELLAERAGLWHAALAAIVATPAVSMEDRLRSLAALGLLRQGAPADDSLWPQLLGSVEDPTLLAFLLPQASERAGNITGHRVPYPLGPLPLFLQLFSGVLLARGVAQAVGRWVLGHRHVARVTLTRRGLFIESRRSLLGRTLRERNEVVPLAELALIAREVQFPRAGLYAGLLAVTIGTLVGANFFMEAIRILGGSPSLLGLAFIAVVLGLALDFAFSSWDGTRKGKALLLVKSRRGDCWAVGRVEPKVVDEMVQALAAALPLETARR